MRLFRQGFSLARGGSLAINTIIVIIITKVIMIRIRIRIIITI